MINGCDVVSLSEKVCMKKIYKAAAKAPLAYLAPALKSTAYGPRFDVGATDASSTAGKVAVVPHLHRAVCAASIYLLVPSLPCEHARGQPVFLLTCWADKSCWLHERLRDFSTFHT